MYLHAYKLEYDSLQFSTHPLETGMHVYSRLDAANFQYTQAATFGLIQQCNSYCLAMVCCLGDPLALQPTL